MKYEMIFGDERLFDGYYDENVFIVIATSNGQKFVIGEFTEYGIIDCDIKSDGLRIAMRRIIAEPKRWTVEDQKAGMLPEVGWMVMVTSVDECASVAAINNDAVCVVFHDGEFTTLHKSGISPIETPEEKAERLEDEFVNELMKDSQVIYTSSEQLAMCRKTARAAYRKLSGALSVPTKGGE